MILVGLVILMAAVAVGVAGAVSNTGSAHGLGGGFSVFGYQLTGSGSKLFLFGIVVGALAVLGLGMLVAGARRRSRLGRLARADVRESRKQAAVALRERDRVAEQHKEAKEQAAQARAEAAEARARAARVQGRAAGQAAREKAVAPGGKAGAPGHRSAWLHRFQVRRRTDSRHA
ncbi:hypothetical protein [Streptacidiphilus melanogenes]|uniref:hypothetical protein n=1 Tax=Streptacidiphilus melanogenes TaxID=411235 RepID=UPI000693F7E6|nr:hypothetical protein [Streptacidiphilus melanogenes]